MTGEERFRHSITAVERFLESWQGDCAILMDLGHLHHQINYLKKSFREGDWHTAAIKANPLLPVLREIVQAGMGLEAASSGELALGMAAINGHENPTKQATPAQTPMLFWDSPAKTEAEILRWKTAPQLLIQVDSLEELLRHKRNANQLPKTLRINPARAESGSDYLNVGHAASKFGISIRESAAITQAYESDQSLIGLHLHGGSGLMDYSQKLEDLRAVLHLARDVNEIRPLQLINIGGGLGFDYLNHQGADMAHYAKEVIHLLSEFGLSEVKLATEMGRWIHAGGGHVVSRVEYVKGANIILHLGADAFVREAYGSQPISYPVAVFNKDGQLKHPLPSNSRGSLTAKSYNLCGPLCFGGDVIQRNVALPEVVAGDYVALLHTGANTFSLWSRHCSRFFPPVYGMWDDQINLIKSGETEDDLVRFWS